MSSASLAGSIVLILAAVALPLMVLGCAMGRIGVNHMVGIRIRYVMASEGAWRDAHRAALLPVSIGAAIAVILDIVGLTLPAQKGGMFVALATACLVLGLGVGTYFANRAALDTLAREFEHDER